MADGTSAGRKALYFAARRAKHAKGRVTMLYVIETPDQSHWKTVKETMRREAYAAAHELFAQWAEDAYRESGERIAECLIREGDPKRELRSLMNEDRAIHGLVLGGAVGPDGPGALTAAIINQHDPSAPIAVPVTVVPDQLTYEDIRQLS